LQIDTKELGETLLAVYNNPHEAKERGLRAQQFIKDNFNYFSVGQAMKARLEEISVSYDRPN